MSTIEKAVELGKKETIWIPKDVRELSRLPNGFHSQECHDFWMQRHGHCVYCEQGSKPVPKSFIKEYLHWKHII